jgi:hypothetical protein
VKINNVWFGSDDRILGSAYEIVRIAFSERASGAYFMAEKGLECEPSVEAAGALHISSADITLAVA